MSVGKYQPVVAATYATAHMHGVTAATVLRRNDESRIRLIQPDNDESVIGYWSSHISLVSSLNAMRQKIYVCFFFTLIS